MPHPLLSDPWVAAKIDQVVAKYGKRWTPRQIEAFREQAAWTLATNPDVARVLEVAHPGVVDKSGERVVGGAVESPEADTGDERKAGNK